MRRKTQYHPPHALGFCGLDLAKKKGQYSFDFLSMDTRFSQICMIDWFALSSMKEEDAREERPYPPGHG
jgi:hypothetical protein